MAVGPRTVEVGDGLVRCADSATDAHHEVVGPAQVGVGGQEEFVELFPAVVATREAPFDVGHDGCRCHGVGDRDDPADAIDGARFEGDGLDPEAAEPFDECDGLVEVGDAGRHRDAPNRRAAAQRLDDGAGLAEVQPPQVRIEIQGVEMHGDSLVEQFIEFSEALGEDCGGDLSAAGEFRPVSGVGGGGDDGCVDGGGGHPGEDERRLSGEPGQLGVDREGVVGQAPQRRCEGRESTVDARSGAGGEQR